MSLWQRLQKWLGRQVLPFDQTTLGQLQNLAEQERRPFEAVAADLIAFGLQQRLAGEGYWRCWQTLSPREQEVAALICLGYTNAEITARLHIAIPTVKTHVRNILRKFGLPSRSDLRHALAGWDFSEWERA